MENSFNQLVRASSSDGISGGMSRWVERCWPTVRHALLSDTPNRLSKAFTALRRRSGVSQHDLAHTRNDMECYLAAV